MRNNNTYLSQSRFFEARKDGAAQNILSSDTESFDHWLSRLFALVSSMFGSQTNLYDAFIGVIRTDTEQGPEPTSDYGYFAFANFAEQELAADVLSSLKAAQQLKPGRDISRKFIHGKHKFRVSLSKNADVLIERRSLSRGIVKSSKRTFEDVFQSIQEAFQFYLVHPGRKRIRSMIK